MFDNVKMRYKKELGFALEKVTFDIEHGYKVGIVGRTGAGKSSILQSLFRLIDLT
jgi:ABC-type multidrug transport system fused ATPase/permease subunit